MNKVLIIFLMSLFFIMGCKKENSTEISSNDNLTLKKYKSNYKVAIVTDTIDDWSTKTKDGIISKLDEILSQNNSKAEYTIYDTEVNIDKAAQIVKELLKTSPDLIFTLNYPDGFADVNISKSLENTDLKIISMNPVPLETGIINSWEKPGHNITGVSIFLQMNSPIRLMKKLNPKIKKLVVFSWDIMTHLNNSIEKEIKKACLEENIELVEFAKVPYQEATIELFEKYNNLNKKTDEYFLMGIISAFVTKSGSPIDDKLEYKWLREHNIPLISYDETGVEYGSLAGVSTIWSDIGAQLAEKSQKILEGEKPGDLSWEFPRKYNILINKKRADFLEIKIDGDLLSAAYKVYTDYEGNFAGKQ